MNRGDNRGRIGSRVRRENLKHPEHEATRQFACRGPGIMRERQPGVGNDALSAASAGHASSYHRCLFSLSSQGFGPWKYFDEMRLNPQISPETVAALRAQYGVDKLCRSVTVLAMH